MALSAISVENPLGSPSRLGSAVLHRSVHQVPEKVIEANGDWLVLGNGQRVLDATGGAAVACLGHGNTRVMKAMQAQMEEVSYCTSLFFSNNGAEKLADFLVDSTQGKMAKALMVNSGSEATEASLKLARQYFLELPIPQPQRTKFIARRQSYHGSTLGALALGGHVSRRALFEPIMHTNSSFVSPCYAYRARREGESSENFVSRLAQELEDAFQAIGSETVCAFVAESIVGAALGCVPAVEGYFSAMKAVCDKHGALLILDEVMSGMGRCGTLHAWEQEGIVPDIQTIGKGLGGGYAPIAGMLVGHKVTDALTKGTGAFSHGQTYQAYPAACAAAYEVQQIIQEENLLSNVRAMGQLLEKLLREKFDDHKHVGDIRGKGLFWGIEFVQDKVSKQPFEPSVGVAMGINKLGLQEPWNISLYPGTGTVDGRSGDHIIVAPAYNVHPSVIETISERTKQVVDAYFHNLNRAAGRL